MVGMKIVFVFGQSTMNREIIFCCFRELLCRHLALVHCRLMTMVSILSFSFKKTMAQQNLPIHPRERLTTAAPQVLDFVPKVDLQVGRFFISNEEFESRINSICFQFWKIQAFAKFVHDNYHKIRERHLVYGDLCMFVEFLSMFLYKEFVDPKGMFRKICRQHPFEFLIMFELCRE